MRLGIVGAGHWAQTAHIPSFQKCKEAKIEAICDTNEKLAIQVATRFGIPKVFKDYHELLELDSIDAVDVCASAKSHYEVAKAAIRTKRSVLCEKPLAMNLREARSLRQEASQVGVKTKMGFTFRYSPAFRRMKELIAEGFVGEPYLFNGFEQNYQFINPKTPFRWNPGDNSKIMPGSLEEYAPHIIDLALWLIGDMKQVVGNMRNYLPERFIRDMGKTLPINIEDASVWLADFENRAQGTFQSSFVAVGGYPGVEARVYGSKGAIIVRLVEEGGVRESLRMATAENPDFCESEIPDRLYGTGRRGDNWIDLCYGNLAQSFVSEVLEDRETGGDFLAGVKTQEVEDAVFLSHRERRWVQLPLD